MRNRTKINVALLADTYEVKMNLIEDWDDEVNDRMIRMGYRAKVGGYNSLDYYKAMIKLIPDHPRKVHYSKEFSCPDVCGGSLDMIVSAIESGNNLLPYMSKQAIEPSKNDGLLNDWGIHHFHLNEDFEKDTVFIKRSDWLLLAIVKDEAIYFLNVFPHKKPYLWAHIQLIRIIDNNWPHLIENNRLEGAISLSYKLNDQNYTMFRKANLLSFVELDENKIFALIGGGYASDGSSIKAVRTSDNWLNYLKKIELYIRNDYHSFKRQMLLFDSDSMDKKLEIKFLTCTEEELILLEKHRNVIIKINYDKSDIRMLKPISLLDNFSNDL